MECSWIPNADGHRVAFNRAFAERGYGFEWSVELYGELLKVAGGKERMRHYFDRNGWPCDENERDALVQDLHRRKTDLFMNIIESGELPLRPGAARLVDEAITADMTLAVCSTSNERSVHPHCRETPRSRTSRQIRRDSRG